MSLISVQLPSCGCTLDYPHTKHRESDDPGDFSSNHATSPPVSLAHSRKIEQIAEGLLMGLARELRYMLRSPADLIDIDSAVHSVSVQ